MGLLKRCIETYDAMSHLAGVNVEGRQVLAPVGHIVTKADIEITISANGEFIRATAVDVKVPIPCSESSAARTSSPEAHPLCDQIGYVCNMVKAEEMATDREDTKANKRTADDHANKHRLYLCELKKWKDYEDDSPVLNAIYKYVSENDVYTDIIGSNIEIKDEKQMIVWRVEGIGHKSGAVYENTELQKKYIEYYSATSENETGYCMITGTDGVLSTKHLKGVVSKNGNAKIISANDNVGYTYRGRFHTAEEACSVGYMASQKAHNALKWIIANQGVLLGGRACVCWNPKGIAVPKLDIPIVLSFEEEKLSPSQYREELKKTIYGYRNVLPDTECVIIAMFDAATSGRLSITYYNELSGSDFLNRLEYWDETTAFPDSFKGVHSPRLRNFIDFAYGTYRGTHFETDDKIFRQLMQKMIICRVEKGRLSLDVMRRLMENASRLHLYDPVSRENILHTTCSAIRKYHIDTGREDASMSLDKNLCDRSYQYGRLLAVLEKIEKDTYEKGEGRETNAIRGQQSFVQAPQRTFVQIVKILKQGYYAKLSVGAKAYYEGLIGEIVSVISDCGLEDVNKPLDENYLIGYYLQKQALYSKKSDNNADTTDKDEEGR